jgi:tetratricopeptide (TPR) repeat protein
LAFWKAAIVVATALYLASCATKTPPALPSALKYPDFVYPAVPQALKTAPVAPAIDTGWRFLQNDQLTAAAREFSTALTRTPGFYPALVGQGWVAQARKNYAQALMSFDAALSADRKYVPALLGRGQALIAMKRDADALTALESALAIDPTLTDVRQRVDVLRLKGLQEMIARARAAARAGRAADAIAEYNRAIPASPDSSFLYRELAALERMQGDARSALIHYRKAVELEPSDGASWLEVGKLLEEQQDFDGAMTAYRKSADIEPSAELTTRMAAIADKAREARLPAEYKAIPDSAQITRGDLAALIGIRLEPLLRLARTRQVVVTDARGHWAATWITRVVGAGIMDEFDNHTFQPRQRVRRIDLATAVSRVLALLTQRNPALRARWPARPKIADMPATHLSYPAVSTAVASGVVPLLDGERFQMTRPVSGAEAIETIERLHALAPDVR